MTNRTIQRRLLLSPSKRLREITLGALGRAQRRYSVRIHAFVFLSNHYHLLVSVEDVRQLALFVGYFESKLAKEVGRLTGWKDVIWPRRYHAIPVSSEDAAQVARLEYILSHGVKEHLVAHPTDWPGASSARALLEGKTLRGVWHDRTAEYRARMRGEPLRPADFVDEEVVELTVLPCWQDVPGDVRLERMKRMVAGAVEKARRNPQRMRNVLRGAQPTDRPFPAPRRPAPRFHCFSKTVRDQLALAYSEFIRAYREAALCVKRGELTAAFPDGCFPPPRPFVAESIRSHPR